MAFGSVSLFSGWERGEMRVGSETISLLLNESVSKLSKADKPSGIS